MVKTTTGLRECDGHRTAVVLFFGGRRRVVVGNARREYDQDLGGTLRIVVENEPGFHDLFLVESEWEGEIVSGEDYGCEFCLLPGKHSQD